MSATRVGWGSGHGSGEGREGVSGEAGCRVGDGETRRRGGILYGKVEEEEKQKRERRGGEERRMQKDRPC